MKILLKIVLLVADTLIINPESLVRILESRYKNKIVLQRKMF